jgi:hypothetical protein
LPSEAGFPVILFASTVLRLGAERLAGRIWNAHFQIGLDLRSNLWRGIENAQDLRYTRPVPVAQIQAKGYIIGCRFIHNRAVGNLISIQSKLAVLLTVVNGD